MASLTMALLFLISIFFSAVNAVKSPNSSLSTIKAAYWPSGRSFAFPASAIDTTYFTHIYFAFLVPDPTTYKIAINQQNSKLLSNFTSTLHAKKPTVKALLSIGGGGSNSTTFAEIARIAANRAAFIGSTIAVARNHGLHGLDLDWEFPVTKKDMDNLGTLFAEWRAALAKEAAASGRQRLLLTAAVYFAAEFVLADHRSYPMKSIAENLDWVNVMCFDYRGSWDTSATGAHAALYDANSDVSTSFGLQSWVNGGVPARKVVLGLPLYGHTWRLKDADVHGIGAPAVGVGPGNGGVMLFKDLMDYNVAKNATVLYDGPTVSMYSYKGLAWIGYDGATSVKYKIEFAKGMKLGGYFFWALGYDKDWMVSKQAWRAWS